VIVVVCLNPALDVTHHVGAVDWGGVNRPRAVRARPGGKGLNVARTLPPCWTRTGKRCAGARRPVPPS